MAKTVIALEATMNTSGAEGSVKSLKAQLREAQAEVAAIADKFGETSIQAAEAAKKAAALKDRIGDAKALTDAFNPDKKFQAFSSALSGVAGGFAAVQGAMGLIGVESKDVEKTLLKVQSAMALSQGLSAITESADAFKNLKTVAVSTFNSIKTAIGSSGIGLLVVALGAIYAYWDDIKGAVSGVSAEQKKLNESANKNLKIQKEKLDAVNSQDNILKLQGKSERDILKIKLAQTNQVIAATETQIKNNIQTTKAQVEAAKRNQSILKGILEFLTAPLALILKTIDKAASIIGKDFGLESGFYGTISKLVFDPEKIQQDGDNAIKEQEKALNELKNTQAGYQLSLKEMDNKVVENKKVVKEDIKKINEDSNKEIEKIDKKANDEQLKNDKEKLAQQIRSEELIQEGRLALIKDANLKRIQEIENARQKEIDIELDALSKGLITQEQYNANRQAIDDKYNVLRDEQEAIRLQKAKEASEANNKLIEIEKENKLKAANEIGASTMALADLVGKQTAVGKGLAIAATTIETFSAAQSAYKRGLEVPYVGMVLGPLNAAIAVAQGIKRVKEIAKVKVPGSASSASISGSGGGTAAPIGAQMGGTALQQAQINATGNAAVQAFVLESDVSGNQERIERLNRAARIQ